MKALLDTQLLIWTSSLSRRLPAAARDLIEDGANEITFSVTSIWEVAIKAALRRSDFTIDPSDLREQLLVLGYRELPLTAAHAVGVRELPPIHRDPFDRILIAQAAVEGLTLLTSDRHIARYPGDIVPL